MKTRGLLRERLLRRFAKPLAFLLLLHLIGTAGYLVIGGTERYTVLDALYMTFITIATIGYGEVIDLHDSPFGRLFTMLLGFVGIGTTWYIFSQLTAFIVEGEFNIALKRGRMLKSIEKLSNHYVVCGVGRVGANVAHELAVTGRPFVIIDASPARIDAFRTRFPEAPYLHGDAAEDEILLDAGVQRAAGAFAVVGDDAKNLVITLSARQFNPGARIVSRCHDVSFTEKMRRVGADAIVSPDFTGGMRIASSMIRPQVVTFLDEMLRSDRSLRMEEIAVADRHDGAPLGAVDTRSRDHILVAVRRGGDWRFNPAPETPLARGDVIIAMTTPEGRRALEERFA
jgi:voltage-gated potassium channel